MANSVGHSHPQFRHPKAIAVGIASATKAPPRLVVQPYDQRPLGDCWRLRIVRPDCRSPGRRRNLSAPEDSQERSSPVLKTAGLRSPKGTRATFEPCRMEVLCNRHFLSFPGVWVSYSQQRYERARRRFGRCAKLSRSGGGQKYPAQYPLINSGCQG
jgi:hypothetical protein